MYIATVGKGTSMRDIVLRRIAMQLTRIRFARYPAYPFCECFKMTFSLLKDERDMSEFVTGRTLDT